jgi:hypothetical protein
MANHIAFPMAKQELLDCTVELKIMSIAFFDIDSIVSCEFVPRATPMNAIMLKCCHVNRTESEENYEKYTYCIQD